MQVETDKIQDRKRTNTIDFFLIILIILTHPKRLSSGTPFNLIKKWVLFAFLSERKNRMHSDFCRQNSYLKGENGFLMITVKPQKLNAIEEKDTNFEMKRQKGCQNSSKGITFWKF